MSLYHKYRPNTLEGMIGNEGVVKAVTADLAKQDPPHAFLFHGPTGCGKTTLGRIVAKILGSSGGDFREVDSADFRGIDTIRELRKQSAFKPLEGKCKVWLIDECFVKGTYVDTPWGGIPIESIRKNHIIYSLAGEDKVVETFEKKIPLSRLVKLTTEDNREIYCSNTHQFFTPQGWVTAQDMVGSFTYSFSRSVMEDITLGELVIEDSHRSGWVWTQYEKRYQTRHEENSEARTVRVEGVEIYEPGYNDQSFARVVGDTERAQGYIILYDIQVEKHPSYFANGLAVHNCHKLTNDAQNALLKALEDAPSHVYYILATTDPQKLIPTIKGRCSQYQVRLLTEAEMSKLLRTVTKSEGQKLTKEVLEQIVQDSQGHPRNALQILDQVLGVSEELRMEVARKSAETQSQTIELCRALMGNMGWKKVASILSGLTDEDPESIRRMVLGYCNSVLLRGDNPKAGLVMENFIEPFYNSGWPGLTFACYSILAGE